MNSISAYVHSMETMGLLDGPGIRTIFFLQGCPLRCRYCHNPDTQTKGVGRRMTPQEVLQYAKRYKPYHGEEGGITFSGGEPLLQGAFLASCLKLLKTNGFNTCVDSSGFGATSYYPSIFPYVDTLLLDIKAFSDEAHRQLCAVSEKPLLSLIERLEDYGFTGKIWIRHVMIPGFTDNHDAMRQLVQRIRKIQYRVERLEILPYHTSGIAKYHELKRPYSLEGVPPMDPKEAKAFEIYANQLLAEQMRQTRYRGAGEHTAGVRPGDMAACCGGLPSCEDLAKLPLLNKLQPELLRTIQPKLLALELTRDDFLFQTGDEPRFMYLIQSGVVKIFTKLPDKREQILYIYRPKTFVGGHNLLESSPFWYSGQAMTETRVIAIPADIFTSHLACETAVLKAILTQSFSRIRWAEDLINRLATLNETIKTAGLLLRLAENTGKSVNGRIEIPLSLNRAELSSFSGLTRESLTRKMGEFEALGYIKIKKNAVTLRNLPALEAYLD